MTVFATLNETTQLGVDRIATSPTALALYRNLLAAFEKDATAVSAGVVLANSYVVEAMINALAVTEGKIGNSAVAQAKLKTTTGSVTFSGPGSSNLTLPGGSYGFYPTVHVTGGAAPNTVDDVRIWGPTAGTPSNSAYISLGATGAADMQATQRYVTASPPYDLGDGAVPLFVFAVLDSLGRIAMTYIAEDPPWAYNGPTDIRPDFIGADGVAYQLRRAINRAALLDPALRDAELAKLDVAPEVVPVDQALKQADMPLIPHPFLLNDLVGKTVVLLDPVSPLVERLARLQHCGESVSALLHSDFLRLDNVPLARSAPPGVLAVSGSWK